MGNENSNYNNTYNAWLLYRNRLRQSSASSQIDSFRFVQSSTPRNSALNVTPNLNANFTQNTMRPSMPVGPTSKQQFRTGVPEVIAGSKIPPVPKQIQQSEVKRSSIVEINPQMLKTEHVEQKVMSTPVIPGAQQTILLSNRENSKDGKIKFSSKIDLIDTFKAEVKAARTKIDNIANAQEREYIWILSELHNQKVHLIPDKNKLIYLLKQAKDYETLIIGLRTKRQEVVRIINELNEQKYNDQFKQATNEASQYADSIQQQFVKIDWKAIILEAPTNIQRYIDVINQGTVDPVVQYSLAMIEKEVDAMRPPPPQVQSPTPEPQPTNKLPQGSPTNSKLTPKQQAPLQSQSSELRKMQIENSMQLTEEQDYAALRSSQQLVDNILKSSIRSSNLRESLEMNEYGLVVTTPSQIKTTTIHDPVERAQSPLPINSFIKQDIKNVKSRVEQNLRASSEVKPNIPELSEIKNVKTQSETKSADIKPIKPIVNGFQSTVKPPPTYNAFSIPQNLLK